jgi:hypothetical protein
MKVLSDIMARLIAGLSFLMMASGFLAVAYVSLLSPWQPDQTSGQVVALKIFISRYDTYRTVYVTNFGIKLYHIGYFLVVSGLLGIFAYLVVTRKLKRPTSFG